MNTFKRIAAGGHPGKIKAAFRSMKPVLRRGLLYSGTFTVGVITLLIMKELYKNPQSNPGPIANSIEATAAIVTLMSLILAPACFFLALPGKRHASTKPPQPAQE